MHRQREVSFCAFGRTLRCITDAGTFSRDGLDPGSALLMAHFPEEAPAAVLDLGCGWGPLTLAAAVRYPAAQVTAADVNRRALALCRENLARNGLAARCVESDGFSKLSGGFDLILSNPPIRAGKAVIYRLFAESRFFLRPGGSLLLVIRKQQGAPSARAYLSTLFSSVEVADRHKGYWILRAKAPIIEEEET